jgi:hypothetical protein
MSCYRSLLHFVVIAIFCSSTMAISFAQSLVASGPLLGPEDRLAIVGGTLIERMRGDASLEHELQTRRPDWQLRLRNLGWSGDDTFAFARKLFDPNPEKGFQRLQFDLDLAAPTVVLFAYGFAEASNGADAVVRMESGLTRLVEATLQKQRKVILMQPFALPGVLVPGYEANIEAAQAVIERIAAKFELPIVRVHCQDFDDFGLLPNAAGYRDIGRQLADQLVGPRDPSQANSPSVDSPYDSDLVDKIVKKEELFFHRHRPQNETYLLLFRKHEQGNNAVELEQFDPLVDAADQAIWKQSRELIGTSKTE